MTTNSTFRTRRAVAVMAAAATIAAGCSGDEDDVNDESISDALAEQGEVVDDVEIEFTSGSDAIRVGGLDISLPALADYAEVDSDSLVPPTWQTLRLLRLVHETESFDQPSMTWAVFTQTVAVTDDAIRGELQEQHWLLAELTDIEPSHASLTEGDGVTCRAEIRVDSDESFGDIDRGHVLFSGPGLASSAVVISGSPSTPSIGGLLGDVVESACGSRPDGL